ncbi:hypothetical protein QR77_20815 [Streptomyces sp. 150FB]|nr:hypothetical protein QR77_20815 [Streptomyces sp. 150FB]
MAPSTTLVSMPTYTSRTLLIALSAAAVATGLTGATATAATSASAPASTASRALTWRPCAVSGGPAGQECADLSVPLDYAAPAGRQVTVAVTRVRSDRPEARRGTLLVVPGGPGGSGVQEVGQSGNALLKEMAGAYDIVSLDPRGVGGSTKASCELPASQRYLVNLRSWPAPDGSIKEDVATSRAVAEACGRHGGPVLDSFTTDNEARDIDRFRQALGEEKLSAYGVSYGTYVTAVYAQKYPQHTDRLVLDSSGDPDPTRVERGWLANMSRAAADRFPDFAAWAADPARESEGLRLAQRPQDVEPLFLDVAAKLDRAPRETTTEGVPLTGNVLRQVLQNDLYSDDSFPQLAALIKAAQDPKDKPVLPGFVAQPMPDEDAAVVVAVLCNDVRWPGSVASYERAVAADRARYPLTGGMAADITPCAFWKHAPAAKPTRITAEGPSNVLMVQNLRDPATPYFGALKMREALGDRARLVTVDHGGHGAYLGDGGGDACADRAVTGFLTTGSRPSRDASCPATVAAR